MRASSTALLLAPTVTKLPPQARGALLLTGSHGGRYAGRCALQAGIRAAVFHDAGIGHGNAGIAALALFDTTGAGIPAAAIGHETARIGDADDMLARGRISRANRAAAALGVISGITCRAALDRLAAAPMQEYAPPIGGDETRRSLTWAGAVRRVVLIDSASLVRAEEDRSAIVVTGSHGGLVGGEEAMALRADAWAAAFNDAGIGIDDAGIGRLAPLAARGIAAVTVAAASARIGEAASTLDDGVISAVNTVAAARGAAVGTRLRDVVASWARMSA
jgi:hypothetical protein